MSERGNTDDRVSTTGSMQANLVLSRASIHRNLEEEGRHCRDVASPPTPTHTHTHAPPATQCSHTPSVSAREASKRARRETQREREGKRDRETETERNKRDRESESKEAGLGCFAVLLFCCGRRRWKPKEGETEQKEEGERKMVSKPLHHRADRPTTSGRAGPAPQLRSKGVTSTHTTAAGSTKHVHIGGRSAPAAKREAR